MEGNTDLGVTFTAFKGQKFRFVSMASPTLMKAWKLDYVNGWHEERLGGLDVRQVGVDILKAIKVWDLLSPEVKDEINNGLIQKIEATNNLMEKARLSRKQKYANVPRELTCTKCGKTQAVAPGMLVKKVEKIAAEKKAIFTVEDYVKIFVCQRCHSTKGRKANPELANLPKEVVCKCGAKVMVNIYQLNAKAKKKGTTVAELIKGYKCQKCQPARRGRPKKNTVTTH